MLAEAFYFRFRFSFTSSWLNILILHSLFFISFAYFTIIVVIVVVVSWSAKKVGSGRFVIDASTRCQLGVMTPPVTPTSPGIRTPCHHRNVPASSVCVLSTLLHSLSVPECYITRV